MRLVLYSWPQACLAAFTRSKKVPKSFPGAQSLIPCPGAEVGQRKAKNHCSIKEISGLESAFPTTTYARSCTLYHFPVLDLGVIGLSLPLSIVAMGLSESTCSTWRGWCDAWHSTETKKTMVLLTLTHWMNRLDREERHHGAISRCWVWGWGTMQRRFSKSPGYHWHLRGIK